MAETALRVLVIDADRAIRRYLRVALGAHGHKVFESKTGREGVAAVTSDRPDIIILDRELPDVDGLEVIKQLREWSQIPIIILSVQNLEDVKIAALDAGADDYLTKPFGVGELLARMRVAIRHVLPPPDTPVFTIGDLRIDLAKRLVTVSGRVVTLTPTEYDLLKLLAMHPGTVLTHRQLLSQIWGDEKERDVHLLQVNMRNLRRKLEPNTASPRFIQTEPGVGYGLKGGASPSRS
jgi:two-component system, OmpR family, KDP operon response regulator KdpE